MTLKICTFNILAPVWAQPIYYPDSSHSKLSWSYRLPIIETFLNIIKDSCSIICLQEVTDDYTEIIDGVIYNRVGTYNDLKNIFGNSWHAIFVANDINYWNNWYANDPTSPYAKIKHGTAVFLKKSVFIQFTLTDLSLSNSGNHCAWIETSYNDQKYHIASIHLDSDNGGNRNAEFNDLINYANYRKTIDPSAHQIICGDFNTSTQEGNLSNDIRTSEFKNYLVELSKLTGINLYESTRPAYYGHGYELDHVIIRGPSVNTNYMSNAPHGLPSTTISGVIDYNVWVEYPITKPLLKVTNDSRIAKNFDNCGSDHFPVVITI